MARIVVTIAGHINSGKSTLRKHIEGPGKRILEAELQRTRRESLLVIPEYVDEPWRDLFYACRDRSTPEARRRYHPERVRRYTYGFEISCLRGRVGRHYRAKEHSGIVVFDRGMIEGRETFAQNSFDEGFLTAHQLAQYDFELKEAIDGLGRTEEEQREWLERVIVYLRVKDPRTLYERRRSKRKDGGSTKDIPLEYFRRINDRYEALFANVDVVYRRWGLRTPEVVTINASTDRYEDREYLDDATKQIARQIRSLEEEMRRGRR